MRRMKLREHGLKEWLPSWTLLDVRERNSMAITPNTHIKSHTVRGRPTLKLVERFGNGSVRKIYERSILRSILYE